MSQKDTSWEKSATWYDEHLASGDTYHSKVILPNLMRMLELTKGDRVLDLGCGSGFFTAHIASEAGKTVGTDLSSSLVKRAREKVPQAVFHEADARDLSFAEPESFDCVVSVLALQNMERMPEVVKEAGRVLKKGGRFLFVLNHPAFRIPGKTAWGYDEEKKIQFRRIDGYLSSSTASITMHPGTAKSETTVSFHHSLQEYMKALRAVGFAVTRLEEWISHRKSEAGPRAKAEDLARKEIPLFLAIEARKIA